MKRLLCLFTPVLLLTLVAAPSSAQKKERKSKVSPMADSAKWEGTSGEIQSALSETIEGFNPDDSRTLARAGILLLRAGNKQGAADLFRRAEQSDRKDDEAFAMIGEAYGEAQLWAEADAWFQKATDLDPSDADHQAVWGVSYWNRGQKEKAIELFVSALSEAGKSPRVHFKIGSGIR